MQQRLTTSLPGLLWLPLAALLLWLAWPGLAGPFVFDDLPNLERLQQLQGQLSWNHLGQYLASFHGNPGRPLATLSFLINDVGWPSTPWGFKYTNLLLHMLAGLMSFGLARALALAYDSHGCDSSKHTTRAAWIGLIAAAIWLLHPIQVSAVFLVVQRMTILSALFVLVGLWAYVALLQRAATAIGVFFALSMLALFTVLAFLCKENGALAPLYAWVLHTTLLRNVLDLKRLPARPLALSAVTFAALLPFVAFVLRPDSWLDFSNRAYTLGERLLTQPRVLMDYLQSIVLPRLSGGGSVFHDDYVFSTGWLTPPATLLALIAVAALLATGIALRRRKPWLSLAILWFLAGHSVESTFVSLELYFEHRNYLPLFGIALALARAVTTCPARYRSAAAAVVLMWLALAAFVTRQQAHIWSSEVLMAEIWGAERPASSRAVQLRAKVRFDRGDLAGARAVFSEALARGTGDGNAALYVLLLDCHLRKPIPASQLSGVREALSAELADIGTSNLVTQLREQATSQQCPGFTLDEWFGLTDAMLKNPRRHGLHFIYHERARARQSQRDLDGTLTALEAAYKAQPAVERANLIAGIFASAGLFDEARQWAITARDLRVPPFKAWLQQRARNSAQLLKAIDDGKRQAEARSLTPPKPAPALPADPHSETAHPPTP